VGERIPELNHITKAADGGTEVLLGPPFKFDASNTAEWKTVYPVSRAGLTARSFSPAAASSEPRGGRYSLSEPSVMPFTKNRWKKG
jgi:hypothetical protein